MKENLERKKKENTEKGHQIKEEQMWILIQLHQ